MNFFAQQRSLGRGRKLKLDKHKVRRIRKLRAEGLSQREVAKIIGVSKSTIAEVDSGLRWGHVQ